MTTACAAHPLSPALRTSAAGCPGVTWNPHSLEFVDCQHFPPLLLSPTISAPRHLDAREGRGVWTARGRPRPSATTQPSCPQLAHLGIWMPGRDVEPAQLVVQPTVPPIRRQALYDGIQHFQPRCPAGMVGR